MSFTRRTAFVLVPAFLSACAAAATAPPAVKRAGKYEVTKTDDEWKKLLTPEQYDVLRHSGTERAFTGKYWNEHRAGTYKCAGCAQVLFLSEDKFDSGTGWPSYTKPAVKEHVEAITDSSHGMSRTEVRCQRCGGHLGHVFDDGPRPTGMRYCINSASLTFEPK
jgi:peptide-methionine (R)-S-oxide reductase